MFFSLVLAALAAFVAYGRFLPFRPEGTRIQHLPPCSAGLDKSKAGHHGRRTGRTPSCLLQQCSAFEHRRGRVCTTSQSGFGVSMRGWEAKSPPCAATLLDGLGHRHPIRSKPPCKSLLSPNFDLHLIVDNFAVVSR